MTHVVHSRAAGCAGPGRRGLYPRRPGLGSQPANDDPRTGFALEPQHCFNNQREQGGLRTSALLTRTRMCAKCLSRRVDPPYRPPHTAAMRGSQMSDYNVSFRSVLRGYDQEQVDQHMSELAQAAAKSWQEANEHTRQINELMAANAQLKSELESLSERARVLEEAQVEAAAPTYTGLGRTHRHGSDTGGQRGQRAADPRSGRRCEQPCARRGGCSGDPPGRAQLRPGDAKRDRGRGGPDPG